MSATEFRDRNFIIFAYKFSLMISICIPVYNYDVRPLVHELHRQANSIKPQVEILLADDASSLIYQHLNKPLQHMANVVYHQLPANIGRSRIRNLLAQKARYRWLLFMDCDSGVISDRFLLDYAAQTHSLQVVCGGRVYSKETPQKPFVLHWKYGVNREVKGASRRNLSPYHSFMTNNFMVPKEILTLIPFDESISGYGHEDTLWGFELMRRKLPVLHIDNPLCHIDLENHQDFLQKSAHAISNLFNIYLRSPEPESFAKFVRILRWQYLAYKSLPGRWLLSLVWLSKSLFHKLLKANNPNLLWYDLLRIAWLNRHWKKHYNNSPSR